MLQISVKLDSKMVYGDSAQVQGMEYLTYGGVIFEVGLQRSRRRS
ncbi:MAG: hypothetical protein H6Q75_145 [Firmicutes bacterium]|nr:hypothetical protein [Bacillota bacterium]